MTYTSGNSMVSVAIARTACQAHEDCRNEAGEDSRSENTSDQLFVSIETNALHDECSTPPGRRKRPTQHQPAQRKRKLPSKIAAQPPCEEQADRLLTLYQVAVDMLSYDHQSVVLSSPGPGCLTEPSCAQALGTEQRPSGMSPAAHGPKGRQQSDSPASTTGRRRSRSDLHGPCDHCGVTDSPQWRKGPKLKPVLCNACGTRFLRNRTLGRQTGRSSKINAAQAAACHGSKPASRLQDQTVPQPLTDDSAAREISSCMMPSQPHHSEVVFSQSLKTDQPHQRDVLGNSVQHSQAVHDGWLLQRLSQALNTEQPSRPASNPEVSLRPGWLAATSPTLLASSLTRMQPEPAGAILSLLGSMVPDEQCAQDIPAQLQSLLLSQMRQPLKGEAGALPRHVNADAVCMHLQLLLAAHRGT